MRVLYFGESVQGKDHEENEDFLIIEPKLNLFAVADGVSTPRGGKIASHRVLGYLKMFFDGNLKGAIEKVNKVFVKEKFKGLSEGYTTIAAVCLKEKSIEACNVGDSQIFIFRKGKLKSLAFLDKIPGTSTLTQAIGEELVNVHVCEEELKSGDYVLLATDGITDVLSVDEIIEMIEKFEVVEEICKKMIEGARNKWGLYDDDKTLIVIRVEL